MAVFRKVVIVGDGAAGIIAANKLRFHTNEKELDIVVIGNTPRHFYKPDGVLIPFGYKNYRKSVKPVNFLLNYGITYLKDEVIRINPDENILFLKSGKTVVADYIILATGDHYTPEEIPGYDGEAKHFYDLQNALELREYMKSFQGGQVFIGSSSEIMQYPESLYEFAFLLDSYLNQKGLRDKTSINLTVPQSDLSPEPYTSSAIEKMLKEKGIEYHSEVVIQSVNPKNKEVTDKNGQTFKYSLLVLTPPHHGQEFIKNSGIADENGYAIVDPNTLTIKGNKTLFAIGDANNLTKVKSATTAHAQASFVASAIVSEIVGGLQEDKITSKLPEFSLTGYNSGFSFFDVPGKLSREVNPNKGDFMLRWTSADTYFSTVLRGMV